MRRLALLLVLLLPSQALATETQSFGPFDVRANTAVKVPFTTLRVGDISVTSDFVANGRTYNLAVRYFENGSELQVCAVSLDARWGRADGPQSITCVASNAPARDYFIRFSAGAKTAVMFTLLAETNP